MRHRLLQYFSILSMVFFLMISDAAIAKQKKRIWKVDTPYAHTAIFAMGSFIQGAAAFINTNTLESFPGILSIQVGYTGGTALSPTDENHPGYKQAVKIEFNPGVISYDQILDIFWHNIDPFNAQGQFCHLDDTHTAAIFYIGDRQKRIALASKQKMEALLRKKIVTSLIPARNFYKASKENQNYSIKNPLRYKYYRWRCNRNQRLKAIWGDFGYIHIDN